MYVYADNAATTKLSDVALQAMLPYFSNIYGNPSSLHSVGQEAKEHLEDARARMAKCLGCEAREIYFTSGGSEADNQAILSAAYTVAAEKVATGGDLESQERFAGHAELLLGQFLADETLSAENYISVSALFERVGQTNAALQVAQAGLTAFPWHAQLRANTISLRMRCNQVLGSASQTPLSKEIRALAGMRRPNPKIWSEIAQFLNSTAALPPQEIAALKKIVTPLVRDDLKLDAMRGF